MNQEEKTEKQAHRIVEILKKVKNLAGDEAARLVREENMSAREAAITVHHGTIIAFVDMSLNLKISPTKIISLVCTAYEKRFADYTSEQAMKIVKELIEQYVEEPEKN